MLKDHLKIKCSITNAIRLGKKTSGDKPRLLKIMISSIDDKKMMLKNKINLHNESNLLRLIITPDLTPLRNKRLREELANWVESILLKNSRIVQRST